MKRGTSFRLTETAMQLLHQIGELLGISSTAVLEIAIRELAQKYQVKEK